MFRFARPATAPASARAGFRRLLVVLEPGLDCDCAVDLACRVAAGHGAEIVALAPVVLPLRRPLELRLPDLERAAHELLESALATGAAYGVDVVPLLVRTRSTVEAVLEQAASRGSEAIVLGSPRAAHDLVPGRMIEQVLRRAPCRVLLAVAPARRS